MQTHPHSEELDATTGSDGESVRAQIQGDDEARFRALAIKQIKRRRSFHIEVAVSGVAMALLVLIWALGEYHNAGGWPTQGFSQSSGIHDVWNYWIIYPVVAWVLIIAGRAWSVYGHTEISEKDVQREIARQAGPH